MTDGEREILNELEADARIGELTADLDAEDVKAAHLEAMREAAGERAFCLRAAEYEAGQREPW